MAHAADAESYEKLLIQRVLNPIKLNDTRITLNEPQRARLATGHNALGRATSPWTFGCLEACGGLRSSANDMLKFADAALGRTDVLRNAFRMAHQRWRVIDPQLESIGLCWFVRKLPSGLTMLWHNGGTGGYRSFLAIVPDRKIGVVVLSNSAHSVDEIALSMVNALSD